jgi:hypothetical protein
MTKSFAPSLQHVQKDIERLLTREGKREKNERGQTVYRGYQAAVDQMFHVYLEKEAFAPLVAEFRKWNWEWSYDNYLDELSARLQSTGHWSLLKDLWGAVIAKRRTNYNKTRTAQRTVPDKVSEELVERREPSCWILCTDFGPTPPSFTGLPTSDSTPR